MRRSLLALGLVVGLLLVGIPAEAHGSCTETATVSIGPTGIVTGKALLSCSTIHDDTRNTLNLWYDPAGSPPPAQATVIEKTTHQSTSSNITNAVFNCSFGGPNSRWFVVGVGASQRMNGGSFHNGVAGSSGYAYCPI